MSALNDKLPNKVSIGLSNKIIKLSFPSIIWFLFGMQLIMANVLKHSIFYQIIAMLFIVTSFLFLFVHKSLRLNKYYMISILFIFYNIILILLGDLTYPSHSLSMLRTISINLVLFILTYSFLVYADDTKKLLSLYVKVSAISSLIILYVFKDSLFTGRLAFAWGEQVNITLLGIDITPAGSNGIAYFCAIAFLFSTYLYFTQKNKLIYILYNSLFLFTVLTTGSRKGLLILVIGFIYLLWMLNKRSKKIIYGTLAICLVPFVYFLTMEIPVFYEIMGSRLEELVNLVFGREVNDSSINTRLILIDMGISLFKENPLFGHGLDAFRLKGPWGIVTDNNFIEILVSSGIIGFVIYYSYVLFILGEYMLLKEKSNVLRILFFIFLIGLFMELGSVTYFEKSFGFVNAMLFYTLHKEKREGKKTREKK